MNENWLRWKTGYECWIEKSEEKLVFELVIRLEHMLVTDCCNDCERKESFLATRQWEVWIKKKKMDKWYWIRGERKEIDRVPLFCHWILLNKKMFVPHFKCVLLNFSFFENYCILDYKKIGGLQYSKAYNNNLFNQRRSNIIVFGFSWIK